MSKWRLRCLCFLCVALALCGSGVWAGSDTSTGDDFSLIEATKLLAIASGSAVVAKAGKKGWHRGKAWWRDRQTHKKGEKEEQDRKASAGTSNASAPRASPAPPAVVQKKSPVVVKSLQEALARVESLEVSVEDAIKRLNAKNLSPSSPEFSLEVLKVFQHHGIKNLTQLKDLLKCVGLAARREHLISYYAYAEKQRRKES